ncbi:hypothetical protein B296_00004575 [Ensete ventricosum]|uniref:Glycine-rich protein n=1 Tax=Ensete ventricosum TaxID=4639 RepID=A0A427AIS4_ENSVE|nr:hypothetical protein B296_00004575 [Ensete ventricosum]
MDVGVEANGMSVAAWNELWKGRVLCYLLLLTQETKASDKDRKDLWGRQGNSQPVYFPEGGGGGEVEVEVEGGGQITQEREAPMASGIFSFYEMHGLQAKRRWTPSLLPNSQDKSKTERAAEEPSKRRRRKSSEPIMERTSRLFVFLLLLLLAAASSTSSAARDLESELAKGKGKGQGGGGGGSGIPEFGADPGGYFGPGSGFNIPGFGGGWGAGYGGPTGGYSRRGVVRPLVVCSEKGPCYKKRLTCPAKCFSSFSHSGKGYGSGGGGGGCTIDCKKRCVAYC